MANPFPIEIQAGDAEGPIVVGGLATFTDPDNQPGGAGGLPTGWTQDDSDPANVNTNGGFLDFIAEDGSETDVSPGQINVASAGDANVTIVGAGGVASTSDSDHPAFLASGAAGATVALDAGGLDVANVGVLLVSTLGADGGQFGTAADADIAFYGANPTSQPAAPTTLGDVIAALQTLGLVAS